MEPKRNKKMIVVQLPDKKVGISFKHLFTMAVVRGTRQKTRLTHCAIFAVPEEKVSKDEKLMVITFGVAKCSAQDNFNRAKGRKVSLTRALLTGDHEFNNFDVKGNLKPDWFNIKANREIIWKTYFESIASKYPVAPPAPEGAPVLEGSILGEQKLLTGLTSDEEPVVVH
jgi:hypothetical protein